MPIWIYGALWWYLVVMVPSSLQDIVVDPSPLQRELYQEFQNSQVRPTSSWRTPPPKQQPHMLPVPRFALPAQPFGPPCLPTSGPTLPSRRVSRPAHPLQALAQITGLATGGGLAGEGGPPAHVFQSLLYLRKLCSHPLLVLDPGVPQHMQVGTQLVKGWGLRAWLARSTRAAAHLPAVIVVLSPQLPSKRPRRNPPTPPPRRHVQALGKALGPKHGGDWASAQAALRSSLSHAPKLAALQELLLDAGKPASCAPVGQPPTSRRTPRSASCPACLEPRCLHHPRPPLQALAASRA